jgi:hypothetical protein
LKARFCNHAIQTTHFDYLSVCHAWFLDYTRCFHSPDPELEKNIDLKLKHTARVCDNISRIAKSAPRQEDLALAEVCLLHDVGRLSLQDYGSFDDRITTDHRLGIRFERQAPSQLPKMKDTGRRARLAHNKIGNPEMRAPQLSFV